MDLLRDDLRRELERTGFRITLPEQTDARFPAFPADTSNAVRVAREGKLSGLIFVSEISRWEADSRQFVRVVAHFKLIRDGRQHRSLGKTNSAGRSHSQCDESGASLYGFC